jgi:DNA-binding HxlR family transcriptional regulator
MLGNTYESQVCSISRTLEVYGERWTFLIMRNALFADSTRFVDFQRSLGIATNVLSARLDHLVNEHVMERIAGADAATSSGAAAGATRYRMTPRGRDLVTALVALTQWGDSWAAPDGAPVLYTHRAGAHPVRAALVCDECGVLDASADVEALPGPGMPNHLAERLLARHEARVAS